MKNFVSMLLCFALIHGNSIAMASEMNADTFRRSQTLYGVPGFPADYPDIVSKIKFKNRKFRKKLHLSPKYKLVKDYHFLEPQEAMSLEVDSAMVGFMHGTGPSATAMTSVASMFAFGSCIMGLANIYAAVRSSGKARDLIDETNLRLKVIEEELEELAKMVPDQSHTFRYYELNQNIKFYKDLLGKINSYLKEEKKSIRINALISTGTFGEFIGFIGSESMLGHVNVFPALAPVAEYFLAGGLLIVSATSLWEAGKEIHELWKINSLKIPGLKEEMLVVPDVIRNIFLDHKEDIAPEYQKKINKMMGIDPDAPLEYEHFEQYLMKEYEKAVRKRVAQHTKNSAMKISSRLMVGVGTGIFAAEEIAAIAGVCLIPAIGLTITGVGIGIGVAIGIAGYLYYRKYIKTSPLLDVEGLHTDHFETMRMEIFSILLKMHLTPPDQNAGLLEKFSYFSKLSPIDDFSKREGRPLQVPFIGRYEHEQDHSMVALKLIDRLNRKGLMHKTVKPVLKKLFYGKPVSVFKDWEPWIIWKEGEKEGSIHWKQMVLDCFEKGDPKAVEFMTLFIESGTIRELKSLKDELNMTLDQFTKSMRKRKKQAKKSGKLSESEARSKEHRSMAGLVISRQPALV